MAKAATWWYEIARRPYPREGYYVNLYSDIRGAGMFWKGYAGSREEAEAVAWSLLEQACSPRFTGEWS